jgi:hypothetical protein
MYNNQNYPWYIQKSETFVKLYEGLFDIAKDISPLPLGSSFDLNALEPGLPLYQLGAVWGLAANPKFVNGLTYDLDPWSETKVWSGGVATLDDKLYRNFLRAKVFVQNNPYSLTTLKKALELLVGEEYAEFSVEEKEMEFVINIKSGRSVINALQTFNSFDRYFLGQPCGVHYGFNYEVDKE